MNEQEQVKKTTTKSSVAKKSATATSKSTTTKTSTPQKKKVASTKKTPVSTKVVEVDAGIKEEVQVMKTDTEQTWINIGFIAQVMFTLATLFFAVVSGFARNFLYTTQTLVGCTILAMAYNNKMVYKRPHMTIIYTLFGLLFILFTWLGF